MYVEYLLAAFVGLTESYFDARTLEIEILEDATLLSSGKINGVLEPEVGNGVIRVLITTTLTSPEQVALDAVIVAHTGVPRPKPVFLAVFEGNSLKPTQIPSTVTASGIGLDEENHTALDTLTHELSEDCYTEITYDGFFPTAVTIWTDVSKTTKIREELITYSGFSVATLITIQYDEAGLEKERLEENFNYNSAKISNYSTVRNP